MKGLIAPVSKEREPELMGRFESCILLVGDFQGIWSLYADVSELCSIFVGDVSRKNNWDEIVDGTERVFQNIGIYILNADISEHSLCSINNLIPVISSCSETSEYKFDMPTFQNTVCSIFVGGVSRKNNWDETVDGTERVLRNVGI